jgi:peptide/nickel transport system permease protein
VALTAHLPLTEDLDETVSTVAAAPARRLRRRSVLGRACRSTKGIVGLSLATVVALIAIVGPFVAPHSPTEFVGIPFESPSAETWLGTDTLGRDVMSRVLMGGWLILLMALLSAAISVGVGCAAGAIAGYVRGRWDTVIMRTADVMMSFPSLVLILVLVSVLGPRMWLIVVATGLGSAPGVTCVIRAATLSIADREYVRAVELMGVPRRTILRREIVPGLINPIMVEAGLRLTWAILAIAGLAFLGFGQSPPNPDWGIMIKENLIGLRSNAWSVVVPAGLIAVLSVGTNLFAEAIARAGTRGEDAAVRDVVESATLERAA